eukprot:2637273-Prymnesium_polylepis.1
MGSMPYGDAVRLLCDERRSFFKDLPPDFKAPAWSAIRAGNELLARLPLIRVPLDSFGPTGGRRASLLVPIMPGL